MRTVIRMVLVTAVLLGAATTAFPAARSIQSFVGRKADWSSFAVSGRTFTLEGRYSSIAPTNLQFSKCRLTFIPREGQQLPRLVGKSRTIEVTGHLRKRRSRVEFVVSKLRQVPSDRDRLQSELIAIRDQTPEAYYELGRWAYERGEFYNDDSLSEESLRIFLQGVLLERQQLDDGDARGLLALAGRLAEYHQPEGLRQEYVHAAFQTLWSTSRKQGQPALPELATELAKDLEGADQPLEGRATELRRQYLANPLSVYRQTSDSETRLKLHRLLYGEVRLAVIEESAKADGSNGYQIAAKIGQWLPERVDLAESWRQKELRFRLANVGEASREDAIELADLFRAREQSEKASEALKLWLKGREQRLRPNGSGGLIQLADEYIELLADQQTAAELLIEAYALTPVDEIAETLERMEYVFEDGSWITVEEHEAGMVKERPNPFGGVEVDMNPDEVRQIVGAPDNVTRITSRKQIYEIWIYGGRDTSRLAVHFLQRSHEPEARSVAISQDP